MRISRRKDQLRRRKRLFWSVLLLFSLTFIGVRSCQGRPESLPLIDQQVEEQWPPLVMRGGDPYIRALMRTISASESSYSDPYYVLYGGKYVSDLHRHPDECIKIVTGPNKGKCSTAAGRYQMLKTTWDEKAERYHPKPAQFWFWLPYSFEPEYQDTVVYRWLLDEKFWGVNISQLLREDRLDEVLKLLSGTWTSLGYGIEDNMITSDLPEIYNKILQNELNHENGELWVNQDSP
ncbi:Lysozyme [Planktothrix tepida]|uniref:Lysozyme n=1 Tax=Planktothrix tepida PCC 9214 TaxID=671072 RepID=A0A1J1LMI9_9CYAN|nr:glycoside hydrolase family protein [Planktothrix tepida]CAD5939294.1 Lysozyme [Planktothrix tepida]CUR33226.1 Lysozyme [Planktothrix tepida PCC 9214]